MTWNVSSCIYKVIFQFPKYQNIWNITNLMIFFFCLRKIIILDIRHQYATDSLLDNLQHSADAVRLSWDTLQHSNTNYCLNKHNVTVHYRFLTVIFFSAIKTWYTDFNIDGQAYPNLAGKRTSCLDLWLGRAHGFIPSAACINSNLETCSLGRHPWPSWCSTWKAGGGGGGGWRRQIFCIIHRFCTK